MEEWFAFCGLWITHSDALCGRGKRMEVWGLHPLCPLSHILLPLIQSEQIVLFNSLYFQILVSVCLEKGFNRQQELNTIVSRSPREKPLILPECYGCRPWKVSLANSIFLIFIEKYMYWVNMNKNTIINLNVPTTYFKIEKCHNYGLRALCTLLDFSPFLPPRSDY